ncbi:hypothetical protein L596_017272 [Steinernema carpocapsae]|uniref:Uncharacterized protein n=1 Tax=Steinernema carpocapsae TaxID=34508 RepID=A0A4V6A1R5_STECR|nr:hypothetical protein L596_017272 [Steinernema carpocapsae]
MSSRSRRAQTRPETRQHGGEISVYPGSTSTPKIPIRRFKKAEMKLKILFEKMVNFHTYSGKSIDVRLKL